MCGITAFIGNRPAADLLIAGLQRLEYRGYDSAGVGILCHSKGADGKSKYEINVTKKQGKVANLQGALKDRPLDGTVGIAHTRWATHGAPNDVNAHPHMSDDGSVAVVHNGIIENFTTLRTALEKAGHKFQSETDTEILAHLVANVHQNHPELSHVDAVRIALREVDGAFGCCFVFADAPDLIVGARRGSPLILGVMQGEYYLASDASAIVEHTKTVEYLEENEVVEITREGYKISGLEPDKGHRLPRMEQLEMDLETIEKGGYKHFMLKEIMEQPKVLENCMRGRVNAEKGTLRLGGIESHMDRILQARRLIIVACGTSFHSGLVAEYLTETLARLPVEVEYASEFRYRKPILFPDDVVIAISQSGETADTLAAIREANRVGCLTIGIVNVVGSSISRETKCGVYLHVGPEIGVASTKAFTGQVLVFTMMALQLAHRSGKITDDELANHVRTLVKIPSLMARVLEQCDSVLKLSRAFRFAQSFLYLGRGYNYPVALEGALKLKEISYIHAEGYAAAEMKHGPIALIDKFMPVVVIAPSKDSTYDKLKSNVEEVLARGGCVIAITEENNHDLDNKAEVVLRIPEIEEIFVPLLSVVPCQLLSYYIADMRKCAVDQPRNLAKSVTVE